MFETRRATTHTARTRAWIEVDLKAVASNTRQLDKLLSPQTQLMAVVKADGYGHGAVAVAREAARSGARWLGVATVPEAIELRDAGLAQPILIFGAVRDRHEIRHLVHYRLCPTICDIDHGREVSDKLGNLERPLDVHLKLDTGMSRLGTSATQAADFWDAIANFRALKVAGIYSHLATIGRDQSEQITAEEWAVASGTIVWEVLCGFKNRLPRVTTGGSKLNPSFNSAADLPPTPSDQDRNHAYST